MPTVKLSPLFNSQTLKSTGVPASGHKINIYAAGSSSALATYTDSTGSTPQDNPIILNSNGLPDNEIWLQAGLIYKFVWTDENDVVIDTFDNISGINDTASSISQWPASGVTPTYVSTTSFTLSGDQTTEFHVGRRLQFTTTAGTVYGTILTSAYTTPQTTVTMTMDTGMTLDSGLSVVNLSILRADNSALPTTIINEKHGADIASAATLDLTNATGNVVDVTGATPITAISLIEGAERTVRFTGALTLTNGASLVLPGSANITTAAGDFAVFRGYASGVVRCVAYTKFSGLPVLTKSYDSGDQTITAGSGVTLSHGLGVMPKIIEVLLHCLSADVGYASGDYVKVSGACDFDGTNSRGTSIVATSTGLIVRFGSATNTFNLNNATTGVVGSITNSKWALVVKAYA